MKFLAILKMPRKGFTLIELLVILGIIIVIAAFVLTVLPGLLERSQVKGTEALMGRIEIAIEQYYNDNRAYPPTGVTSLKTAIQPSDPTAKRYIEFDDDELDGDNIVDEWGSNLVYTYPGTQNTSSYDLYSTGPDGTSTAGNDADDINNWSQ